MKRWMSSTIVIITATASHAATIEQEHWIDVGLFDSFSAASDLRQEFTPTQNSLDSIQLCSAAYGQFGSAPVVGAIRVRNGLDGEILGVSDTLELAVGLCHA